MCVSKNVYFIFAFYFNLRQKIHFSDKKLCKKKVFFFFLSISLDICLNLDSPSPRNGVNWFFDLKYGDKK